MKKVIFDCPPRMLDFLDGYAQRVGYTRAELIRFAITYFQNSIVLSTMSDEQMEAVLPKIADFNLLEMAKESKSHGKVPAKDLDSSD